MNKTPKETAWWIEVVEEKLLPKTFDTYQGWKMDDIEDVKTLIATIIEKERAEKQQKIDELQELLLEANESIGLLSE